MKEAIILAGEEGWRLKPYEWMPKPLLKVNEQTLIDLQISWLHTNGFKNNNCCLKQRRPNFAAC